MTARVISLGDVAEFVRGITFKPSDLVEIDDQSAILCMRTKNVQSKLDIDDLIAIPDCLVRKEGQYLSPGDILISSANSWNLVGKCCWVPELSRKATFGGFVTVLRGNPELVDQRFLYWWFSSERIQRTLRSFGQKTTSISNLNLGRCLKLEIPKYSLAEQRRIAAILDKAESLRTKRQEAIFELENLAQAIFIEMFGDPIGNPMGWDDSVRLGEVADVVSGITKGRKLNGKQTREVPYLAVSNVQDMRLSLDSVKVIEVTEQEIIRYALQPGDLLLTEGGDPDKLGRGTLWSGELPECIHQNHVFRVRTTSEQITPRFLNWLIASARGKRYFLKSAKQTTGIASINMTQLRNFPLLLPPIVVQQRFEEVLGRVKQQKENLSLASQQAEAAFASIQYRAFQGTL